jgi:hypothetical protein
VAEQIKFNTNKTTYITMAKRKLDRSISKFTTTTKRMTQAIKTAYGNTEYGLWRKMSRHQIIPKILT